MTDATNPDDPETPVDPESAGGSADSAEKEWWDNPALPWRHKPTRVDIACYTAMSIVGIYLIVMFPLRPLLLANPQISALLNGGRTAVVATGALLHVQGGPTVLYWIGSTIAVIKFDWVYWWAGALWGPTILESFTGSSRLSKRRAEVVLKYTHKYETLMVIATYLPLPLPMALIYAAVGVSGMRLWKFLTINILSAAAFQAGYLALGWWIGEPAVRLVKIYADFAWYVTLAFLAGMLVMWWWRRSHPKVGADADSDQAA